MIISLRECGCRQADSQYYSPPAAETGSKCGALSRTTNNKQNNQNHGNVKPLLAAKCKQINRRMSGSQVAILHKSLGFGFHFRIVRNGSAVGVFDSNSSPQLAVATETHKIIFQNMGFCFILNIRYPFIKNF